ncbi:MAG: EAL domain-containing protein, partial [Gemmatimonadaceae bacterium]
FIKQNLVETMVKFANDHGAMVIAEGVERAEEFMTVRSIGVHLVQGFFLHKPGKQMLSHRPGAAVARTA